MREFLKVNHCELPHMIISRGSNRKNLQIMQLMNDPSRFVAIDLLDFQRTQHEFFPLESEMFIIALNFQ